ADSPENLEAAGVLKSRGVLVLTSHAVTRAEGKGRVRAAVAVRLEGGQPAGDETRLSCDIICMSGGFQPANSLLYQAGCRLGHDESLGEDIPREMPATMHAAGQVTGIHGLATSLLQGRLAGTQAAASLGRTTVGSDINLDSMARELAVAEDRYRGTVRDLPPAVTVSGGRKRFVCFCEDVTAEDIADAIAEGFDDIQMLKRYTTVSMGPCQGKLCLKALVGICARQTGRSIAETGVTTARPPLQPVPLGALAGPSHLPIKRTPMDRKHRELGAPIVDLGPWQRAYSYGSPQEECLAVRHRVGIIDVSTLGKLDVRGRDAPALLDKVYTHRFSSLGIGRIRYGLLCSDNSTILDDGTVARMGEDRYFVTTTTGNVDFIEEWFKWWLAGTGMCAHVTNLTSAFAAVNVAGPRARDTLVKLTDIDLSPDAFRYMRSAQGTVAGVPAIFLRIGFVGETGWELHVPAEYGEYLWDTLMEAGQEFGIAPFGLEAQRILRLEKKHIIVGQDTDAVSNPLESDMDWVVRFDKDDFIGRGGLVGVKERGLRNKLVGFVMRDGGVPEDGDPVVVGRSPVGRVTSARLSPTLGRGFGMAWVPGELAQEGMEIHILVDGKAVPADVTLRPFYDPEGKRLRE
ncbi:MAG: glycine cleavage T C-terminal barrel domain-containing protein, partial [Candidatus Neomarinimicrobiota bacterium]